MMGYDAGTNSKTHMGTLLPEKGEEINPAVMQANVDQTEKEGNADDFADNFGKNPDGGQNKGDGETTCCLCIELPKQICQYRERKHKCLKGGGRGVNPWGCLWGHPWHGADHRGRGGE